MAANNTRYLVHSASSSVLLYSSNVVVLQPEEYTEKDGDEMPEYDEETQKLIDGNVVSFVPDRQTHSHSKQHAVWLAAAVRRI